MQMSVSMNDGHSWSWHSNIFKNIEHRMRKTLLCYDLDEVFNLSKVEGSILQNRYRTTTVSAHAYYWAGFVLTERAYYSRGRTMKLFTFWLVRSIFLHFLIKRSIIFSNFLVLLAFLSRQPLIWNKDNRSNTDKALQMLIGEYFSGGRTIRRGSFNRGSTVL